MARSRRPQSQGPAGKSQGKGAVGKTIVRGAVAKVQSKIGGARGQLKGSSGFSARPVQAQPARPQIARLGKGPARPVQAQPARPLLARHGKGQSQSSGANSKGKGAGVLGVRKVIAKQERRPPQPPPRPLRRGGNRQLPQPPLRLGRPARSPPQPAKGQGKGQWVWVPPGGKVVTAPAMPKKNQPGRFARASALAAGIGRNRGGASARAARRPKSKSAEKVIAIDISKKVWVGGLSPETTSKELEEHFTEGSAKPKAVHLMKGGKAVVGYDSVEEVDAAVAALNGSELGGSTIEVDVWVEKPKPERGERPVREKKLPMKAAAKAVIKTVTKAQGKNSSKMSDEAAAKMKEKLAAFDPSQKVWIGGLAETVTWKALAGHLATVVKPKVTHVMPRGMACACFESASDVETVIAELSNSELEGKTIKVDTWAKPVRERRQKGKAEENEE